MLYERCTEVVEYGIMCGGKSPMVVVSWVASKILLVVVEAMLVVVAISVLESVK